MARRKLRVLWCGESCTLSTGFGTYALEVLSRLHESGKYDLMEYAAYARPTDTVPWKRAGAGPHDEEEKNRFDADPHQAFGSANFERACLSHFPDVCLDYRDAWMMKHEAHSPFRRFYKLAWMPTVDAEGQAEEWLADYRTADAVFTYSDWARDVLAAEGGVTTLGSAPAGADFQAFGPAPDRRAHKEAFGLEPDCLVVGTTMRNQRRKLYPELFSAFRLFLSSAPPDVARRSYLYCHTGWPDVGWDFPRLLKDTGLGSRVLFTYHCQAAGCGRVFPSFFRDAACVCAGCGRFSARMASSQDGVSRTALAAIYNLFDVYVQYADSEGLGIPAIEAAACGVPVLEVDYSAMSDVVRKLGGTPIVVKHLRREVETGCLRAVPDNEDCARKLAEVLCLPSPVRAGMGAAASRAARAHYDWDRTAKVWTDWLDSLPVPEAATTWGSAPRPHEPDTREPPGLTNEEFVRWGMAALAGRPDAARSYRAARIVRDLNWGRTLLGGVNDDENSVLSTRQRSREFGREEASQVMLDMAAANNHWEKERWKAWTDATSSGR